VNRPGPRLGITLGDPRGIGPEVVADALDASAPSDRDTALATLPEYRLIGPPGLVAQSLLDRPGVRFDPVGHWDGGDEAAAGRVSIAAVERGIELARSGELDGLVTAPISKSAVTAAGYPWPGHTDLLRERCGVRDVTMIMGAEQTPLGGPLRIALLTVHVALRDVPSLLTVELTVRRARIAVGALRDWWGIERPRLAFAGVNPHASEGGRFGDEEARILEPAMRRLEESEGLLVTGLFPADTVFRRCIAGEADLVVAPYHDVGLAVLKTLAPEHGINVTAGLPFPRTSPDHGTAFDIAGLGRADARSMCAAIDACARFCTTAAAKSRDGRA